VWNGRLDRGVSVTGTRFSGVSGDAAEQRAFGYLAEVQDGHLQHIL
jgi:hypothetical protein